MGPLLRCQPDAAGSRDGNGPQAYRVIEQPYGHALDRLVDGTLHAAPGLVAVGGAIGREPEIGGESGSLA